MQEPSNPNSIKLPTKTSLSAAFRPSPHQRAHSEVNFRLPEDLIKKSLVYDIPGAKNILEMPPPVAQIASIRNNTMLSWKYQKRSEKNGNENAAEGIGKALSKLLPKQHMISTPNGNRKRKDEISSVVPGHASYSSLSVIKLSSVLSLIIPCYGVCHQSWRKTLTYFCIRLPKVVQKMSKNVLQSHITINEEVLDSF
ncbi:hypothetical protein H5410_021283 [Solanum commersonii]|uniref:Uncharacterized protein n=1 Tax=Solanum commersonii TaxID=4109 RepID=A0A9J5ZBI9_SOLCO|nr:hypothetical protein H5410_021283 [Solanum commersonii]